MLATLKCAGGISVTVITIHEQVTVMNNVPYDAGLLSEPIYIHVRETKTPEQYA